MPSSPRQLTMASSAITAMATSGSTRVKPGRPAPHQYLPTMVDGRSTGACASTPAHPRAGTGGFGVVSRHRHFVSRAGLLADHARVNYPASGATGVL